MEFETKNENFNFSEMIFLEDFAVKYGVNKAIVVHGLSKWIGLAKNLNGEIPIAFDNGKFFVELSENLILKTFKFWNGDFIKKIIKSCEEENLLATKSFDFKKYTWYAIGDEANEYYDCNKMIDLWAICHDRYGGNHDFIEEREGYMCAICGSTENTVVHHIDGYLPERTENNARNKLILLCKSCHAKVHHNSLRIPNSILKDIGYYDD